MPLTGFHPLIADWFQSSIGVPTDVQARGLARDPVWAGRPDRRANRLGKDLRRFLSSIDQLFVQALARDLDDRTHVLYVSLLQGAEQRHSKNLQQPLADIGKPHCKPVSVPELRVLVRTGDTPMSDRQQMLKRPLHILVTTPESLFILLTVERKVAAFADRSHCHRG